MHPHKPKGRLEEPINPTVVFLDNGKKPEYLHAEYSGQNLNTETFLLQGNSDTSCTTMQPFNVTLY